MGRGVAVAAGAWVGKAVAVSWGVAPGSDGAGAAAGERAGSAVGATATLLGNVGEGVGLVAGAKPCPCPSGNGVAPGCGPCSCLRMGAGCSGTFDDGSGALVGNGKETGVGMGIGEINRESGASSGLGGAGTGTGWAKVGVAEPLGETASWPAGLHPKRRAAGAIASTVRIANPALERDHMERDHMVFECSGR